MQLESKCHSSNEKSTFVNPGTFFVRTTTWTNQTWLSSWSRRKSFSWENPKRYLLGLSRTGYENSRADPATNQLPPRACRFNGALPTYLLSVLDGRNGLPAAGTDAIEDSRVLQESVMNPTTDEYDWDKMHQSTWTRDPSGCLPYRWSNEWPGKSQTWL